MRCESECNQLTRLAYTCAQKPFNRDKSKPCRLPVIRSMWAEPLTKAAGRIPVGFYAGGLKVSPSQSPGFPGNQARSISIAQRRRLLPLSKACFTIKLRVSKQADGHTQQTNNLISALETGEGPATRFA